MRIGNKRIFPFLVVVCQGDAVWHLSGEYEFVRNRLNRYLDDRLLGQYWFIANEQRPEPLIHLNCMVVAAVLLQVIERLGVRVNNPLPGIKLSPACAYMRFVRIHGKQSNACQASSNSGFQLFCFSENGRNQHA